MGSVAEAIRLQGITKRFAQVVAVDGVSLRVGQGEFVCLLGPSGCGKTSTLLIIAGFVEPDEGAVFINGQDVSDRPPNKRDIGMVYQSYALFPHMTLFENVAFGLRMRRLPAHSIAERVGQALELVRLTGLEGRKPGQLSGGQQQRVALARAIVIQPTVLLLDEPLSNLDAKLRKRMQLELKAVQRAVGITAIHVTHDQEEALTLADTVVIMNNGRIEQIGAPREVYTRPRSTFVADFIGKCNFLKGQVTGCDESSGTMTFTVQTNNVLIIRGDSAIPTGKFGEAFIRPERITLRRGGGAPTENMFDAEVDQVIFTGSVVTIKVRTVTGLNLAVDRPSGGPEGELQLGDKVKVALPPDEVRLIPEA
jgi:spermidine/putrescine ABC transporter ATP-binding subunit